MAKKIVIALGGNALGNTPKEQLSLVKETAKSIVKLAKSEYEIIVGHGNGPQVGMINLAFEYAEKNMPFPECGAMSQGYIGYHLAQAIGNELKNQGVEKKCACVVTQVLVDKNDPAFENPTKPIGSFYTKEEAEKISAQSGYIFTEDAGRGYRRVVASPKPVEIVEIEIIRELISPDNIIITIGGGGVPVIETEDGLSGIPAVIDKDLSSAKLAEELKADILLILTAVEKVAINFNKPDQKDLSSISVSEAKRYISEGHFAKGSMLPKIEACLTFLERVSDDAVCIITSLDKAIDALEGKTGTTIHK